MLITRKLPNGDFQAESFPDGLLAQAPTLAKAVEELQATQHVRAFAAARMRVIKKATKIAFCPQEGQYVADCPAVGITARGFTRQDAWDKFLHGLKLADQMRRAAEAEATIPDADEAPALEEIDNAEIPE